MRFVARPRWLREQIEAAQPDVVLSFIDVANAVTLWAARSLTVPVLVAERVHPPAHRVPLHYALLRKWLYPSAAGIVVQTEGTADWARDWLPDERVVVIPNPVVLSSARAQVSNDPVLPAEGRWLVAMGRLEHQKGFDLLISAFEAVARDHDEWRLVIMGDGSEQTALEDEIDRRGLGKRVLMLGRVDDPESVLRSSEIFILSSRYEGFPNALCEAMACGLPVVSFDCPTGPSEIIRDGVDGILVPQNDVASLATAIGHLIENPDESAKMAARALELTARFDEREIFARWENLLTTTANGKTGPRIRRD
jgi:glycosyltransferase involved in cell wall biosynthesis